MLYIDYNYSSCYNITCFFLHYLIGIRLQKDQQYTVTFPRQIHVSSAMLCLDSLGPRCYCDCVVEVHVAENGTDHLIGVLAGHGDTQTNPALQCNINIKFDPSRPVNFYVRTVPFNKVSAGIGVGPKLSKASLAVQLVGYFD